MKKLIHIFSASTCIMILGLAFPSACTKEKAPVKLPDVACTTTVSFSQQIAPMIQDNCASCHGSGAGTSPVLSNHSEISANGEMILNTLHGTPQLMPQGGPALADTLIQQFQCWIQQGKLNN
ncbi:hypothetical protein D3C87_196950 [compost metagenome]